jgi:hypothetical protein
MLYSKSKLNYEQSLKKKELTLLSNDPKKTVSPLELSTGELWIIPVVVYDQTRRPEAACRQYILKL